MQSLLILTLIIISGTLLALIVIKDLDIAIASATGFLMGIGLITFIIFLASWLGLKITHNSILAIVTFILVLSFLIFKLMNRQIKTGLVKFKRLEFVYLFVIILFLSLSLVISIYYPITVWDSLALYDFRAKVIADRGFFVQIANQYSYFAHYPIHTSLMHSIVYLFGGTNPQFLYSLYLISFSVIFYKLLNDKVKAYIAALATLLLVTTPDIFEHSTIAYTNLPYTVLYVSGLLFLFTAFVKDSDDYLMVSSILVGLSTWVRSDLPFWITGSLFAIIFALKQKKLKSIFIYFVPFLLIQQTWNRFASSVYGSGYSTSGQLSDAGASLLKGIDFVRVTEVSVYLYKNVISSWGFLLVLFIICMLINLIKKRDNNLILLGMIIINLIGLFVGTYVFSYKVLEWKEIADSASRMAMFFPPLILFYSSMVISDNI